MTGLENETNYIINDLYEQFKNLFDEYPLEWIEKAFNRAALEQIEMLDKKLEDMIHDK